VYDNLGHALALQGRLDEAIVEYQKALKIKPDGAAIHTHLGISLVQQGRLDEAIVHYQQALEIRPDDATAHGNVGAALAKQGRLAEAIAHLQRALELRPDYAEARNNLRIALDEQNRILAATVAQWREAVRLQPHEAVVLNRLAWALATCPLASVRNGTEAVQLAERAAALSDRKEPAILDTLAAAYAEAERFADAVSTAQWAIELAQSSGQTPLAERIRARLALYRAGQPYREAPFAPTQNKR